MAGDLRAVLYAQAGHRRHHNFRLHHFDFALSYSKIDDERSFAEGTSLETIYVRIVYNHCRNLISGECIRHHRLNAGRSYVYFGQR